MIKLGREQAGLEKGPTEAPPARWVISSAKKTAWADSASRVSHQASLTGRRSVFLVLRDAIDGFIRVFT